MTTPARIFTGMFLCIVATMATSCGDDSWEWRLVWEDNFDGAAGVLPDAMNWELEIGTDWGNAQLEFDTDRPTNVSTDGQGHLAIVAREEEYKGSSYTSARINTHGFFARYRGRFEARVKLPVGQGIWPAFWLLGENFSEVGWPECGEIDILEYRGQEPRLVHGSLHGPGHSGGNAITGRYVLPSGQFNDDFHVFGVEWSDDRITWTIDGIRYQTIAKADLPENARWVYDHPFYIILNVAVGGNFVGAPDASTQFPQTMLVDWVRVYRGDE